MIPGTICTTCMLPVPCDCRFGRSLGRTLADVERDEAARAKLTAAETQRIAADHAAEVEEDRERTREAQRARSASREAERVAKAAQGHQRLLAAVAAAQARTAERRASQTAIWEHWLATGDSLRLLADRFGVAQSTVSYFIRDTAHALGYKPGAMSLPGLRAWLTAHRTELPNATVWVEGAA